MFRSGPRGAWPFSFFYILYSIIVDPIYYSLTFAKEKPCTKKIEGKL
jgi:hypothetical protein